MDVKENVNNFINSLVFFTFAFDTTFYICKPPTWCQLATLCNHTGTPECAKEPVESHIRMFLDECDMYEYNCDNRKEYNKIDMLNCQPTTKLTTQSTTPSTTVTQQSNISRVPIGSECTRHRNITPPMTKSTASTITTASTSTICQTTLSTTVTTETITETTQTTLNQSESTIAQSTTTDSKLSTTEHTTTNSTTKEPTTDESTTIESTTPNHTIQNNCTRNVNKTTPTTQITSTNKNQNVTKHVTEMMTTVAHNVNETTIITTVEYEEIEGTTDVKEETTASTIAHSPNLSDCDNYPKDCNRPSTWDTTAKGETRDFYQILKARFGNRVKLLRATTHWPRKYFPYDIDGTFMFGRHSES